MNSLKTGAKNTRRTFINNILSGTAVLTIPPLVLKSNTSAHQHSIMNKSDPTMCDYAPSGEYIKDHSLLFHDNWWHLFSISGTEGYHHGYSGNEETISWSISKDLVNWEMRGHILHASLREVNFDQHEVWAPFILKANDLFYMFYTGVIHPSRPLVYGKAVPGHKWDFKGHKETQGLAVSTDLTNWTKVSDHEYGLNIPGRDSHVVWNEAEDRWLLYRTGPVKSDGFCQTFVFISEDLKTWDFRGLNGIPNEHSK